MRSHLSNCYLCVIVMDVRFKVPANFYVSGQSQSGKSSLIRQLLRHTNELFYPVPTKIIYCYGEYQKEFEELRNVDLVEGFPSDLDDLTKGHDHSIVVLDDLMSECSKDQRVSDLFTRGSHHKGISVFYLTQNLFPPGKLSRTISLNCHYIFVFKNPRDSLGIATLAKQMFPRQVIIWWTHFMMLRNILTVTYLLIVTHRLRKIYGYVQMFYLGKDKLCI